MSKLPLLPWIDDEPIVIAVPLPRFDIAKLKPTWHEGEPYVLDLDLGRACGYARPIEIRKLIRRLAERPSWGVDCRRDNPVVSGTGGRHFANEHLLTEKQVVLVCMHCELPNIDAVQSLIADVFIAWRHAKLRSVDAETEVKLQEATDRAIDATPDLMGLLHQLARREDTIGAREAAEGAKAASERTLKAFLDAAAKKPQKPYKEATDCSMYLVWAIYRGLCPCCKKIEIMKKKGALEDNANWDHWENKVWKRGPFDGWYVCRGCNVRFENNDEAFRADRHPAWLDYLGHVKDDLNKLTSKRLV